MDNIHLIDSHAHMTDSAFNEDRDEIIKASIAAGVKNIIEIGCNTDEWQPSLELCEKYKGNIFCALGLHPEYKNNFTEEKYAELERLVHRPEVLAIGEIGLDYFWEPVEREKQISVFEKMLALTEEVNKPVVLHIRKAKEDGDYSAYEDVFEILKNGGCWRPAKNKFTGVLHCFSGRETDAYKALDMGMCLGINGIISYKKNDELRETVKKVGLKNIILETDCPYLPPQSKRGTRNSPVNIPEIAVFIADMLNVRPEEAAEITTQNCRDLFGYNF
ncbi:TatD DNase family protein [Parelusimicrobium proximum]|uniref:TatD family hydrolase n=1 Tax=Parelusimicrobium proximum TaxID=3228953 RepID=UPI003D173C86